MAVVLACRSRERGDRLRRELLAEARAAGVAAPQLEVRARLDNVFSLPFSTVHRSAGCTFVVARRFLQDAASSECVGSSATVLSLSQFCDASRPAMALGSHGCLTIQCTASHRILGVPDSEMPGIRRWKCWTSRRWLR